MDKTTSNVSSGAPFRVIVVGAGVAGLTASHCLQKAGIDHVVLERRDEVAPAEGASIAMYPQGSRILHQLGCLKPVEDACKPDTKWWMNRPDGTTFKDFDYYDRWHENHGKDLWTLERRRFLEILYDGLPDKSYIRTNCNVKSIQHHVSSVDVTLADGTVETGDMVLGVDGVSSLTRSLMWEHADKVAPGTITQKDKTCIKTNYKSLIGIGPHIPNLRSDVLITVYDKKFSFLVLTQPDHIFWFVFFRLKDTLVWPNRGKYTDEEAQELAASIGDHPITKTCKFSDLWESRTRGALIPIEEGVLDRWYYDRIVLAGDAAHKVTPNIALGGNSAMESIVVLCNHLNKMLVEHEGAKPSRATLNKVFEAYQAERHGRIHEVLSLSAHTTRMQAWDNWLYKFMAMWVMPLLPSGLIMNQLGTIMTPAPRLDYVPCKGFPKGKMGWKHPDDEEILNGKA
ncbi:FAD/NAD(P)-binding domain-containing protein [Hypoxylon sp. FL1284]|nr:FAD/NAD(P)-binding domain-containing protein [Hypoxylon sp. FL1284]